MDNKYIADLHVHSRFSRATSKSLGIKKLAAWAGIKGISVVATGDFTHPGWMEEIERELEEEESGLLALRDAEDIYEQTGLSLRRASSPDVRFILCTEISSIYKKGGRVRKIHNLVFMSSLEKAKAFNKRLEKVGNLCADGRPILGLDCKHLLEMVLETDPMGFLIPAHVWTPWFSLFGSNSGFNSIEECFGELSTEIFALETGLSSDPPMNWLWSNLDRFYLISNSDAHSGEKLAREANLFKGEISYYSIYHALKYRDGNFLGTIEFFPEEGKYHLDGHRKCGIVLHPREAIKLNNICPVCGRPLTIGVMHRVLELADREEPSPPEDAPPFISLIPLCEILSEIMGVGPRTKRVLHTYANLIERFGSEIGVLMDVDTEDIRRISPLLSEGIERMRRGEVRREPGFDGRYGKIYLFEERGPNTKKAKEFSLRNKALFVVGEKKGHTPSQGFNPQQKKAICSSHTPLLVIAGPGTGKTRTLVGRAIHLLKEDNSSSVLVLTFTLAAAEEVGRRIEENFGRDSRIKICTLHSLGYELWERIYNSSPFVLDEEDARNMYLQGEGEKREETYWRQYLYERERMLCPSNLQYHKEYSRKKKEKNLVDYTDLLEFLHRYLLSHPPSRRQDLVVANHILVDEIQDLSPLQMEIIRSLCGEGGRGFFGIGDPDQTIYSFRGAMEDVVSYLKNIWGDSLEVLNLTTNYRSAPCIIRLSSPLISFGTPTHPPQDREEGKIYLYHAPTGEMEARWIAKEIKRLIGGTSHMEADRGRTGERLSPGDIAVLVRFRALLPPIKKVLERAGLPCSTPAEINFWEDPLVEKLLQRIKEILPSDPMLPMDIKGLERHFQDGGEFATFFWQSESIKRLGKEIRRFNSWQEFLNWINLQKEFETISSRAQKVVLSSLHGSKGLEFQAVFLPCLEEGILPFNRDLFTRKKGEGMEKDNHEQEEQRLLYVGITRAKTYLFLSYADRRILFGQHHHLPPSPFLKELPLEIATRIMAREKKRKHIKDLHLI